MERQSYKNHVRWYPPHHFVYYPILLCLIVFASYQCFTDVNTYMWILITIILVYLFWLSFMLRQHYALTLQDRLAKLEVHYRYFSITGNRLEVLEPQLSTSQILALRFASDAELSQLVQRTINEQLTQKQIKESIINWRPDLERV